MISGEDVPVEGIMQHGMVAATDQKSLYAIGGSRRPWNDANTRAIFKYHCPEGISTCTWTKAQATLKYPRTIAVAFEIPKSLSDKICN